MSRETKVSDANGDKEIFPCSADHEQDWQPYAVDLHSAINKVSTKSGLNTICRLNSLLIFPVKLRNSSKGKYFRHLTRVLVRFPETKSMSKFTVPHFFRGENVVHSSVERV